jgi:hypothetical protein
MADLMIRPSWNDHHVITSMLAPGAAGSFIRRGRPVIDRLILDATLAFRNHKPYAEAAESAGIPLLIDPLTFLAASQVDADDPWHRLPYAPATPLDAHFRADRQLSAAFVEQVIEFEIERGATAIIPPYEYVAARDDPRFEQSLGWIRETARAMRANSIALPIMPVFCASLRDLGSPSTWERGIDRFLAVAREVGPSAIGLLLTPLGDGKEGYGKLHHAFSAFLHAQSLGVPVIALRQGVYGPSLCAAGISGYETGVGLSEQAQIKGAISRRAKPRDHGKHGGGTGAGVYLEPLGRSLRKRVAEELLASTPGMRAKLLCTDERCCPHGAQSMLDERREHAIRTRSRELSELDAVPGIEWRLNHVRVRLEGRVALAQQANDVLTRSGVSDRIATRGFESLIRITRELSQRGDTAAA